MSNAKKLAELVLEERSLRAMVAIGNAGPFIETILSETRARLNQVRKEMDKLIEVIYKEDK